MFEKIQDIFTSKKKKFQKQTKKEKHRIYLRKKIRNKIYGKKRVKKQKQLHIHFNIQRKNIILFSIIGFLSALIGIIFIFKGSYFSIQNISIQSPDNIIDINIAYNSIDSIRQKNIFTIDKNHIKEKLKAYQKNIKSINIKKKLPNSLHIDIESFPILFSTDYQSKPYFITSNGIAIPQKQLLDKSLPPILIEIVNTKRNTPQIISYKEIITPQNLKNIFFLIKSFNNNLIDFKADKISFYTTEAELHILLKNKTLLIFDGKGDIVEQIKKLVIFYKKDQKLKNIYMDLRIENKIFYCDYDSEYQCRKNLSRLYSKK